jgi:hypothetical protein
MSSLRVYSIFVRHGGKMDVELDFGDSEQPSASQSARTSRKSSMRNTAAAAEGSCSLPLIALPVMRDRAFCTFESADPPRLHTLHSPRQPHRTSGAGTA